MISLVPIESVRASAYNPRKNDEKRLELTELSLKKLGFLLPIYADSSGEILSGHQRHMVALKMGFSKIPVQYVNTMDLEERKTLNILFNRATNDLQKQDTCEKIKKRLYEMDIKSMYKMLPDIEPNSKESFPCIYAIKRVDSMQLAKRNYKNFDSHIKALASALERKTKSIMPIIIGENNTIINGIGRLETAMDKKHKFVQCVVITKQQEDFASAMLNLLSMDFDMKKSYADVLRYNSFMRSRNTRETDGEGNYALGDGFFKGIFPKNNGRDFFKLEGEILAAWKKKYGNSIVDFGAGKLNNTKILRNAGVFVSAFEPYFIARGDKIHKQKSIEIAEKFLEEVASGVKYHSVFLSSVFNSVPFMEDRVKIVHIVAALCQPEGKVICWCQSNESSQFILTKKHNINSNSKLTFDLDYEPNIVLGDISRCPKVQKGHTKEEMQFIFKQSFQSIERLEKIHTFWYLEAKKPKIDIVKLGEAINFEFELPYPDGTTMGLSKKAKEAFEKRLKIVIP